MRILLLSTSMGMGGADKLLLSAAQEMQRRDHEVLIVSLTPLGPMGLEAQSVGVPTESLDMRRGWPDPRGLLGLARRVRSWKPDVLHSHMVHANLLARVLRVFVPVPVLVSTIHNIYDGGPLRMAAYRATNRLADLVTIVSQAAADRFVREGIVPRVMLRVIPNGLDTERFGVISAEARESLRQSMGLEHKFVWIAVGRFELSKDYPNMLHAFARVRQRAPDSVLLLVGRGTYREEIESLARTLGLADAVRLLGVRNDVSELMSAADAYLMSSAWEGMPIVLLEAATAGLPIVATAVGGNHEVVRHEESGFLVPSRDAEALAQAMERLTGLLPADRRRMGERGREHVRDHYGLSRMVDRWEAVYLELLARKGLAPASSALRISQQA
jgi:glycosyltransferase involved in cell wall biosynthesis